MESEQPKESSVETQNKSKEEKAFIEQKYKRTKVSDTGLEITDEVSKSAKSEIDMAKICEFQISSNDLAKLKKILKEKLDEKYNTIDEKQKEQDEDIKKSIMVELKKIGKDSSKAIPYTSSISKGIPSCEGGGAIYKSEIIILSCSGTSSSSSSIPSNQSSSSS